MGLLGGTAWAAGNGAQTSTQHLHGDATGLVELDLNPADAPAGLAPPVGCWFTTTEGIVSTDGNAIMHNTTNKAGDFWFTTTYTGGGAVYPLVLDSNGNPIQDPVSGNNEVDTSAAPLATGHLTTWFGQEDNNKNGVLHATVSFHGTETNGTAVNLNAHFQLGSNAHGQPTATVGSVTC